MDFITSLTSQTLNKALDGLSMRHKAIASNLANVETPGYKRRDVQFEGQLQAALEAAREGEKQNVQASNSRPLPMKATRPEHIPLNHPGTLDSVRPSITEQEDFSARNDGNGVDLESEMVHLAKNTEHFAAVSRFAGEKARSIKNLLGQVEG